MEEALKQRLVGASVLVVLAVIFLPLLFDGSGMAKPTAPLSLDLPEANAENTVTITLKPKPVKNTVVADTPRLETKPVVKAQPEPTPVVQRLMEPITKPAVKPKPAVKTVKSSVDKGQWVIQLGSFSQRSNAQALRDKLINHGYKSFVESSGRGSTQVYRVRVGPESSRERAEAIRKKLHKSEKRNGLVMAYP